MSKEISIPQGMNPDKPKTSRRELLETMGVAMASALGGMGVEKLRKKNPENHKPSQDVKVMDQKEADKMAKELNISAKHIIAIRSMLTEDASVVKGNIVETPEGNIEFKLTATGKLDYKRLFDESSRPLKKGPGGTFLG